MNLLTKATLVVAALALAACNNPRGGDDQYGAYGAGGGIAVQILGKLRGRVVGHGDGGTGRGQDRSLLPAARRQAQHIRAVQLLGEPCSRHRQRRRQDDSPVTAARGFDLQR